MDRRIVIALAVGAAVPSLLWAGAVVLPHTFSNGVVADATQVNANFGALATATDAKVERTGDTMTGALALPANGLAVGGTQLAVSATGVGVGVATATAKLDVRGDAVITGGLRPDYTTGWFAVNTATHVLNTFTHNFGSIPSHYVVQTATSNNPTWVRLMNPNSAGVQHSSPESMWMSATELRVSTCCSDYVIYCDSNNPCPVGSTSTTGYMRVLLWK